ncbi:Oxygen regulatory protein NreC [bioreactor metagenome]|uniref:Oxygen regulatory protein NreC n=1 Tax=bioreactor metagenome TaxID=1076179 RepID=A0A644YBC9_9ZZZZ
MSKIRLFIAEDHTMLRQSLVILLSLQENLEVVGEAADGQEAYRKIIELKPDIAILDISIPQLNGIDLAIKLRHEPIDLRIIIMTMHKSESYAAAALRAGVRGYILKDNALEELIECIDSVSNGNLYLSPSVTQMVVEGYIKNASDETPKDETLSTREREILQLLAEGKSNKDVSEILNLSIKTVETHRNNIMRKLGIKNVVGLVLYAVRNGLIEP